LLILFISFSLLIIFFFFLLILNLFLFRWLMKMLILVQKIKPCAEICITKTFWWTINTWISYLRKLKVVRLYKTNLFVFCIPRIVHTFFDGFVIKMMSRLRKWLSLSSWRCKPMLGRRYLCDLKKINNFNHKKKVNDF